MNTGNTNIDFDKIVECYFYIHRLDFIFGAIVCITHKQLPQTVFILCYKKILIRLCRLSSQHPPSSCGCP